jgi:hypothetical protein
LLPAILLVFIGLIGLIGHIKIFGFDFGEMRAAFFAKWYKKLRIGDR